PREAAMPELIAGTLVALPLRDKRLEATQVTLVQLASRNASLSAAHVIQLLVSIMKERTD
ncbi:MAG: LysR family transcriptional regulator, partial [Rhizobiales bacterium]|nr:LysR family transcriptional regulator [Hyphomicrobiales bacterium]